MPAYEPDLFDKYGIDMPSANNSSKEEEPDLFDKYGINPDEDIKSQPQQAPKQQGFLHGLAKSAPVQGILGAGDAAANVMRQFSDLALRTNFGKTQPHGEGTAYKVGKFPGEIAGYSMLAAALEPLGIAAGLPAAASRIGTAAIYGAATNPENRGMGALTGGAIGGAAESILPIGKGIYNAIKGLSSKAKVKEVVNELGGGQTIDESNKILASSIEGIGKKVKRIVNDLYRPFRSVSLSTSGLATPLEEGSTFGKFIPDLEALLTTSAGKIKTTSIGKLFDRFLENPTYHRAHLLQSGLKQFSRELKTEGTLGATEKGLFNQAGDALQKDIVKGLVKRGLPDVADQYKAATKYFLDEYVPIFRGNKLLGKIASGKIKNPGSAEIKSLFSNPEKDIQLLASKLSPQDKNRILYAALGRSNITPNQLLSKLESFEGHGLSEYMPESLKEVMGELPLQMEASELGKRAMGTIAGAPFGGGVGSLVGMMLAPRIIDNLSNIGKSTSTKIPGFLQKGLKQTGKALKGKIYKPLITALKAHLIPEQEID